jgi:hypothetical protein
MIITKEMGGGDTYYTTTQEREFNVNTFTQMYNFVHGKELQ